MPGSKHVAAIVVALEYREAALVPERVGELSALW